MKRAFLIILVVILYALHQDFWFWRTARPLLFGFLPTGIWYHACFTLAVSVVMWILIQQAWPAHLEAEAEACDPAMHFNSASQNQAEGHHFSNSGAAQPSGTSRNQEDEAR
jgi:hypothetical protein